MSNTSLLEIKESARELLVGEGKLFRSHKFDLAQPWMIDRIILRYNLINYLVNNGHISLYNISKNSRTVDIGCYMGCSTDSLAMFGGDVQGTDPGEFACVSPSGLLLRIVDGKSYLNEAKFRQDSYNLVACFNADWCEYISEKDFVFHLYEEGMKVLKSGGQILFTLNKDYVNSMRERFSSLPNSNIIEIPLNLNKMEDYILVGRK